MDTNAAKISCLRACATLVPLAALLGGCVAESNNSNTLGRKQDLAPSLEAVQLQGVADNNSRPDTAARSDQASLTGPGSRLNRGAWEPVPFVVPIDGIDGMPTYSRHTTFADDTARQRGEFPTPISSLELAGDSLVDRRDEMLFAPIDSFAQAMLMVPRFFFVQPWDEVRHEPQRYWMAPGTTQRITSQDVARYAEPKTDAAEPAGSK
jgi:hypothetical protein